MTTALEVALQGEIEFLELEIEALQDAVKRLEKRKQQVRAQLFLQSKGLKVGDKLLFDRDSVSQLRSNPLYRGSHLPEDTTLTIVRAFWMWGDLWTTDVVDVNNCLYTIYFESLSYVPELPSIIARAKHAALDAQEGVQS